MTRYRVQVYRCPNPACQSGGNRLVARSVAAVDYVHCRDCLRFWTGTDAGGWPSRAVWIDCYECPACRKPGLVARFVGYRDVVCLECGRSFPLVEAEDVPLPTLEVLPVKRVVPGVWKLQQAGELVVVAGDGGLEVVR